MLLIAHGIKTQTVVSCFELCAIPIHVKTMRPNDLDLRGLYHFNALSSHM